MLNRFVLFRLVILLVFFSLIYQLWVLQFHEGEAWSDDARGNYTRRVYERPLRGEIFASDGKTILAESLPSDTIAILPSQLPEAGSPERQAIFAWLDDLLGFQSTLTVTPTEQLTYEPRLQQDIELLAGPFARPEPMLNESLTITMPVGVSVKTLELTRGYTDTLIFQSPIETMIANAGLPAYETIPLTTTLNLEIGRIIEENKSISPGLPGVQVEPNYHRSYPKSGEVMSLSHLLGYVGTVDRCDIVRQNPPELWPNYIREDIRQNKEELLDACYLDEQQLDQLARGKDKQLNYLLTDRIGRDGLERTYERDLRGQLGQKQVEVDVAERLVSKPSELIPTQMGNNLVLTIDYELQKQTEQILRKWIEESDRRRRNYPLLKGQPNRREYFPIEAGVAIAMEVKTGRILSMVSWPAYDNNIFNRRRTQDEVKAIYDPGYPKQAPAINQAIAGRFPPGSTWKQISAAAALTNSSIGSDTQIRDPGFINVKNSYFENDPSKDQHFPNAIKRDNGWIGVRQALQVSSNVFFQSVVGGTKFVRNLADGEKITGLGKDADQKLADIAYAFGFGQPTGIPLYGEINGVVPSAEWKRDLPGAKGQEAWTIGETYNTAIGQGDLLVTPLQLTVASAAIANGGNLYQPQLVKSIIDANGQAVREIEPVVRAKVPVKPEHLQVIREGMRMAIAAPNSIDKCASKEVSGLDIAGKTGTAEYVERIDPDKPPIEGNIRNRSHAWFAGFAPYDNPEIEVVVLVEGAGDMNDGSATIAVPAVTEIMQAYYKVTPPIDPATPIPPYNLPCH